MEVGCRGSIPGSTVSLLGGLGILGKRRTVKEMSDKAVSGVGLGEMMSVGEHNKNQSHAVLVIVCS